MRSKEISLSGVEDRKSEKKQSTASDVDIDRA